MPIGTLLNPLRRGELPQSSRTISQRFKRTWAFKDSEKGRYFIGTFAPVNIPEHFSDKIYIVEAGDTYRPDIISYKFYRNPNLYWIILWLNGISDPFSELYPGMALRIPTLQRLAEYGVAED